MAGLALALPAQAATGLIDTAHEVYGEFGTGFYSLDTMLCEGVFRAAALRVRAAGNCSQKLVYAVSTKIIPERV